MLLSPQCEWPKTWLYRQLFVLWWFMWYKTALSYLHGTTVKPIALLIYPGWIQPWTWEKKTTTNQQTNTVQNLVQEISLAPHIRNSWQREGSHSLLLDSTPLSQKAVPFAGPRLSTQPGLAPCRTAQTVWHVRTCFHPGNTPGFGTRREVMGWGWKQLCSDSSPGQNCYRNIWANCWGF